MVTSLLCLSVWDVLHALQFQPSHKAMIFVMILRDGITRVKCFAPSHRDLKWLTRYRQCNEDLDLLVPHECWLYNPLLTFPGYLGSALHYPTKVVYLHWGEDHMNETTRGHVHHWDAAPPSWYHLTSTMSCDSYSPTFPGSKAHTVRTYFPVCPAQYTFLVCLVMVLLRHTLRRGILLP